MVAAYKGKQIYLKTLEFLMVSNSCLLQKLEVIELDRAGVKGRTYHNTVYKLRTEGPYVNSTIIYLVTEGATPLKTFLEVQQNTHRYARKFLEITVLWALFLGYQIVSMMHSQKIHMSIINYIPSLLAVYMEYKREIIQNFYLTLQNLLNDNPDCRDVCELVYYEGKLL